jgi:hypothetical protein
METNKNPFYPPKKPLLHTEGYPSRTCDMIFSLHMDTVTSVMPRKDLTALDKARIMMSSRAPLHVCQN